MFGYREGTASVADAIGNLLFYTDGVTIWDRTNQVMANGTGLAGGVDITQSALIVKQPGTSNIYLVFTVGHTAGLSYSIVDMNLAVGMGSVTVKNTTLAAQSTEKLAGTKHCNGIDTWVLSHDYGTDVFRAILITTSGVSSSATLSSVGSVLSSRYESYGTAKFSQNGKKLGCALYHPTLPYGNFELFDFDNSTGLVSNPLALSIPLNVPPQPVSSSQSPPPPRKLVPRPEVLFPYGCEFSPDGSKFYGSGAGDTAIYQWDLCAGSNAAITNSRYTISSFKSAALQLAKDGKIYVARPTKQVLGVINSPDQAGTACNYVAQGPSIAPAICSYGLPNIVSEVPYLPFSYSISGSVSCNTAAFTLPQAPGPTVTACSSTGHNITGFIWYFGDPSSGPFNTSTLSNPVHSYPGQGTYTAYLVYTYNNACGGINTDTLKQEVKIGVLPVISPAGYDLCSGRTMTLSVSGAQTYSWNTGSTTSSIAVSPSITTSYTVSGLDQSGCHYVSTQTVHVYTTPTVSVLGPTVMCPGYQTMLKAYGANTYSWNTGSTTSVNIVIQWTPSVTYTVYGNSNGCVTAQPVTVLLKRPDVLISGGNVTVCPGTAVTMTVTGTKYYVWSTGSSGSTVVVTPTVTTSYTVQGMDEKACVNKSTTSITVQTKTAVTGFSYTSPICEKTPSLAPIPVDSFNTGGTYYSFDLPVDSVSGQLDLSSVSPGNYFVTYLVRKQACLEASSSTATLAVAQSTPLSITQDLTIVPGSSVVLHVSGGITYSWSPSANLSCTNCSQPVASPPENTQYCVSAELNSCSTKTCVNITVSCETSNDYSVPNAFTPNGDGNNDEFCLRGWDVCTSSFQVEIFDRWGEKVFESTDPNFCWSGVYKGKLMDAGVFVYVMSVQKFDKTTVNRKGNITLIR